MCSCRSLANPRGRDCKGTGKYEAKSKFQEWEGPKQKMPLVGGVWVFTGTALFLEK